MEIQNGFFFKSKRKNYVFFSPQKTLLLIETENKYLVHAPFTKENLFVSVINYLEY